MKTFIGHTERSSKEGEKLEEELVGPDGSPEVMGRDGTKRPERGEPSAWR